MKIIRKLKKEKKGWLRIVEAFLAVMLVMSVLVSVYVKNIKRNDSDEIYRLEKGILEEIADDDSLRADVLNGDQDAVLDFVKKRTPNILNASVKICDVDEICVLDSYDIYSKYEIYASERIISSTLQEYEPKVVKIFMWKKNR